MVKSFLKELCSTGIYKPNLGKVARRLTFLGIALVFVIGAYVICHERMFGGNGLMYTIAGLDAIIGLWLSYRLINFPVFADFLISVETEMVKVYWPSKKELFTTTKVVLIFMFLFIVLIFFFDVTLNYILGIVKYGLSWFFGLFG